MWSRELAAAAEEHIESRTPGRMEDNCENPVLFLLEYADGLRAASLILNGHLRGWGYAGRSGGVVQGMEVFLHGDPHPHFVYMGLNIQEMFLTGKPQYPVERTLLVSGALDALMESRYRVHVRVEPPHMDVGAIAPMRRCLCAPWALVRPDRAPYPGGRASSPAELR